MDMLNNRAAKLDAFLAHTAWADSDRRTVAGDASNRRYDRLRQPNGSTAILMDAPPEKGEDVRPFIHVAEYLRGNGLSAPAILEKDIQAGFLIIEDLGDDLFASLLSEDPSVEKTLYAAAVDALVQLHAAAPLFLPRCDPDWFEQMNRLIFDWYAPDVPHSVHATFDAIFRPLAQSLESVEKVVILRDYHAQNLLWLPDRTGVARVGQLDFQDALLGHPAYDLVSILKDARRDVPEQTEAAMIDRYLASTGADREEFLRAYAIIGVQRNLCIAGIFARLCIRDGKPRYLDLIPRVWDYVRRDLAHPSLTDLARLVEAALPAPSPMYLQQLKDKCPSSPH